MRSRAAVKEGLSARDSNSLMEGIMVLMGMNMTWVKGNKATVGEQGMGS